MASRGTDLSKAKLVAASCVTETTRKKYASQWPLWKSYCRQNNIGLWSATSEDLLAFLQFEYSKNPSVALVCQRMSTVSYYYRLKGLVSPSTGPAVAMYLRGLKRCHLEDGPGTRRAKPLTKANLKLLNKFLRSGSRSLRYWRTIWRINLCFYCLLRWDDVCRLKVSDFALSKDDGLPRFDFQLVGGKTLIHDKNKNRRLYALPDSPHCPVKMTLKYFALLGQEHDGSVVPQCQASNRMKPHATRVINYTSAVKDLHLVLQQVGIDPKGYSDHSMRRGGATEAARQGATTSEIQVAGDWSCPRMEEKYVEANHRHLGLFNQHQEADSEEDAQSLIKDAKKSSKKKILGKDTPVKGKKRETKRKMMDEEEPNEIDIDDKKMKKPKLEMKEKVEKGGGKQFISSFNDKNVDVNLHVEPTQNIKEVTVKINHSLLMKCHVIDVGKIKTSYKFAALTFIKKLQDGRAFEFSLPLKIGPDVQNAIQCLVEANPQFFIGMKTNKLTPVYPNIIKNKN